MKLIQKIYLCLPVQHFLNLELFGKMIFDIAEIFPEAFPDSFDKYPGLII